jgi:hypothetical protein
LAGGNGREAETTGRKRNGESGDAAWDEIIRRLKPGTL